MTVKFGFRAVSEEYSPEQLIQQIVAAEEAGFDFVTASDHFHPWFHDGANAPHAWITLAAAASVTRRVQLGTGVTSPFSRYHPGIVAQAFATLQRLSGDRVFLAVGTGEAMNEVPLGLRWASYTERLQQLREAIEVIRRLWDEDFVNFDGKFFRLRDANLYTKPSRPPRIFMAASGPRSARTAGEMADGLYTFSAPKEYYVNELFPAFEEGVKESGRSADTLDRVIEFLISYDRDYTKALQRVGRWRGTLVAGVLGSELYDPRVLENMGGKIPLEELERRWFICTRVEDCLPKIEECVRLGFTMIEIHSASADQEAFIRSFRPILAHLRERNR